MQTRGEIERALLTDLKRSQAVYEQCRKEFAEVVADIPSGIPHPDGQARIVDARVVNSSALENYSRALREFNDFIISGIVPSHLGGLDGL